MQCDIATMQKVSVGFQLCYVRKFRCHCGSCIVYTKFWNVLKVRLQGFKVKRVTSHHVCSISNIQRFGCISFQLVTVDDRVGKRNKEAKLLSKLLLFVESHSQKTTFRYKAQEKAYEEDSFSKKRIIQSEKQA